MNAGQMLGLLAGAGALGALSGGKDGKRFNSIVDMFDGGGAGQSGDKFEGGGLLSALGNLFAKPVEAQDRVEQIAARTAARNAPAVTPRPQMRPVNSNTPLDAFGGAGPNITGTAAERGMGLDPFGGYGAEYTAPSYANMPMGEVGRGVAPQMDIFQQATTQIANELGNAFYMMPQQEQLMRIQQRVDMMRGM